MGLKGTIPPQLGNLSFLIELDLSRNEFNGKLPKELVHLRRLKLLNLSYNIFDGIIPPTICNLSSLEFISFSINSLSGDIPKEIGYLPQLKVLHLEYNKLSGHMPLTISNHSVLQYIDLPLNFVYDNLLSNICRGLPKIQVLRLGETDSAKEAYQLTSER